MYQFYIVKTDKMQRNKYIEREDKFYTLMKHVCIKK